MTCNDEASFSFALTGRGRACHLLADAILPHVKAQRAAVARVLHGAEI